MSSIWQANDDAPDVSGSANGGANTSVPEQPTPQAAAAGNATVPTNGTSAQASVTPAQVLKDAQAGKYPAYNTPLPEGIEQMPEAPVSTRVTPPHIPDNMVVSNNAELYKYLSDARERVRPLTDEEKARLRREHRTRNIIAGSADMAAAIANLIGTTQYAPNWFDPSQGMAPRVAARYERMLQQIKDDEDRYYAYVLQEAGLREKDQEKLMNQYIWNANADKEAEATNYAREQQDYANNVAAYQDRVAQRDKYLNYLMSLADAANGKKAMAHSGRGGSRGGSRGGGGGGGDSRGGGGQSGNDNGGADYVILADTTSNPIYISSYQWYDNTFMAGALQRLKIYAQQNPKQFAGGAYTLLSELGNDEINGDRARQVFTELLDNRYNSKVQANIVKIFPRIGFVLGNPKSTKFQEGE